MCAKICPREYDHELGIFFFNQIKTPKISSFFQMSYKQPAELPVTPTHERKLPNYDSVQPQDHDGMSPQRTPRSRSPSKERPKTPTKGTLVCLLEILIPCILHPT